jgi:hypothetical protein
MPVLLAEVLCLNDNESDFREWALKYLVRNWSIIDASLHDLSDIYNAELVAAVEVKLMAQQGDQEGEGSDPEG